MKSLTQKQAEILIKLFRSINPTRCLPEHLLEYTQVQYN